MLILGARSEGNKEGERGKDQAWGVWIKCCFSVCVVGHRAIGSVGVGGVICGQGVPHTPVWIALLVVVTNQLADPGITVTIYRGWCLGFCPNSGLTVDCPLTETQGAVGWSLVSPTPVTNTKAYCYTHILSLYITFSKLKINYCISIYFQIFVDLYIYQ